MKIENVFNTVKEAAAEGVGSQTTWFHAISLYKDKTSKHW